MSDDANVNTLNKHIMPDVIPLSCPLFLNESLFKLAITKTICKIINNSVIFLNVLYFGAT